MNVRMSPGPDCAALTKASESCRLAAFWDPDGKKWTIGWGATGYGICEGVVWTQEQADKRLEQDLAWAAEAVNSMVDVDLSQGEFDALTDFVYNEGVGNFARSTLLRRLNAGDYAGAATEFDRWVYAGGRVLGGLETRRASEEALFQDRAA